MPRIEQLNDVVHHHLDRGEVCMSRCQAQPSSEAVRPRRDSSQPWTAVVVIGIEEVRSRETCDCNTLCFTMEQCFDHAMDEY